MHNEKLVNVAKVVGVVAIITAIVAVVIKVKHFFHEDPNDLSKKVRSSTDRQLADLIDSMSEEEFYEYTGLIKDKDQLKRIYCIKTLCDDLRDLKKFEDENYEG